MHKLTQISILLLSFFFCFTPNNTSAQNFDKKDWKLKTSKENLKVFTRDNEQSDVKEIRIQTTVTASVDKVMEVLHDVDGYKYWVYKCLGSKKIKINSTNDYYYYTKSDFPFPIADRDLVIRSRQWTDKKTGYIFSHSKAAPNIKAAEKGVVRITLFDSYWKIMPQADGTIKIDYVAMTHPAGKIPAWAINLGITKGPVETMKNFADIVEGKINPKKSAALSGDE